MADGEGTTLGALYLELGLDADQYTIGLELAKQQAMAAGAEIERALRGKGGPRGSLNLSPKVDFRQLHELNRIYALKAKDSRALQREFNSKPLTPKYDGRQLKRLRTELQEVKNVSRELGTISATVKYANSREPQKVRLEVDRQALQGSISDGLKDVGPALQKQIAQGVKKGGQKSGFRTLTDAITSAPKSVVRGFYEGVGITYADQLTRGFIRGIEGKFNVSLRKIGQNSSQQFANAGIKVSDALLKKMGVTEGVGAIKDIAAEARQAMADIVPLDILEDRLGKLEQAIAKTLDKALELDAIGTRKGLRQVGTALGGVAEVPVIGVNRRRDKKLDVAAELAKKRAQELIEQGLINELGDSKSATIVSGGFAGTRGKSSESVAKRVAMILPKETIDFVENTDTDTSANIDKMPKWLLQILGRYGKHNVGRGYNKDAVEAAAKAIAYSQSGAERINFVGYSGGGYVAKEATEILNRVGIKSKGVGIGTPVFGATGQVDPQQYRSFMGVNDPLSKLSPIMKSANLQPMQQAGQAHRLTNYLGSDEMQKALQRFFGVATSGAQAVELELIDFEQQLNSLAEDITKILGDPSTAQFMKKTGLFEAPIAQIKGHRDKLEKLMADAMGEIAQQIEEYDAALAEAEGLVKQVFGVQEAVKPALVASAEQKASPKTAVKPPPDPKRAAPQPKPQTTKSTPVPAPAPQQQAAAIVAESKQQAEIAAQAFIKSYTDAVTLLAQSIGLDTVRTPQIDTSDRAQAKLQEYGATGGYESTNNAILLSKQRLEKLAKDFQSLSNALEKSDLDEAIAELSTIAHEVYHSLQYGFSGLSPVEAARAGTMYAPQVPVNEQDVAAFQYFRGRTPDENAVLSRKATEGASDYKALSRRDQKKRSAHSFQMETQAYRFQAKFMERMLRLTKESGMTIQKAFEEAIKQLAQDLDNAVNQVEAVQLAPQTVDIQQIAEVAEQIEEKIEIIQEQVQESVVEIAEAANEDLKQIQAELEDYTVEILRELSRLTGRGSTRGKKADIVSDLLKSVKPQDLDAALAAIKPFITRGTRGGQKLQKVSQSDEERKWIEAFKQSERSIMADLGRYHNPPSNVSAKELEDYLSNVVSFISKRIAELDELGKQMLAPETRMELGSLKGRLEQVYRQYSPQLRESQAGRTQQTAQSAQTDNIQLARVVQQQAAEIGRRARKTYEAIIKSVAKASGKALEPGQMPQIIVDDARLKELGAKALYDIKRNAIIVDESIAKILEGGQQALEDYAEELKDLVHEGRHAAQFDFGKTRLSQIAGGQAPGVELIAPQNAPASARFNAVRSVQVAQQQAGGMLGKGAQAAIYRTEADAYAFEQFTPQILKGASGELQRNSGVMGALRGMVEGVQSKIKGVTNAAQQINQVSHAIENTAKAGNEALNVMDELVVGAIELIRELSRSVPGGGFVAEMLDGLGDLKGAAKGVALGLAGLTVVAAVTPKLLEFAGASLEAAAALESMNARFRFNFGSEAAARLESVTDRAVDLRQNINQTRQAYLDFASATRGTPLEATADLAANAINQAALVQGLDKERQQRAQVAITQIASKGRLSAEEVRGQLAEALPGSTAIFARSQGMTVREFSRALDQGQFSAEDALPKFLAQLQAETGSGVADAVNTTAAAMTNLQNQTQLLQETVGKGLQPVQKLGINTLASGLSLLRTIIEPVIQLLGAVAIAALGKFAMSLAASGAAAKGFGTAVAFAQSGLKGFVALLNMPANSLAGWTIGIFGAIEAFKIISANFKDAGGAARQFAKDSEKALKDYDRNAQNSRRSPFGIDFNAPSSLETGVVGSILGTEGARAVEQTGQNLLREGFRLQSGPNKGEVMNAVIPDWVPGLGGNNFAPGTTLAEKQAQDRQLAFADAAAQSGTVIDRIRSATRDDSAQRITALNSQIRDIQSRRNALSPDRANDQQRSALTEQERRLTKERTSLEQPLRFLSGRNSAAIELFRKLREEAPNEQAYQEANAQLQMAVKAQEELNRLMSLSAKSAAQMKLELEQVVGKLAEANQQNEIMAANSRASVAESQLAGISEGVAAYQQFINVQNEASAKIAANNEAIAKTAQMLSDVNVQRVLAANQFTSESSPADIRAKAAQMPESEDRDLLEQAASQIETINNTRLDNANQNAQLKEAQAQYVNRIRDLAKSVLDFYRGIEQQAAETALATQQSIAQANTTAAQTRLRSTLIGFQESFTNDFVTALIDLVETLNKPLNDAIAAQQQILSAQSQYFGQLQQAVNLQQQLPSNVPIQGGATPLGGQPQAAGAQPGSMPVMGGAIAGAMPGAAGGMVAIPNTLAGQSPDQIMGSLRGFQSMDLNAAARFSGQGIQQGVSLAGANYQMTVGNIQRQLQQQQAMASVEAEMGRSNARMALTRANREMQQQGIGFDRSLQDLQLRGQVQTPEVEFQQQRLQLDREFQDQIRSLSDFQRGLSQTIQQQEALKGMIESGQLPGLEDFLPDIQATIDNARNEFNNLDRNVVAYRQAYESALARQQEEFSRAEDRRRFEAAQRIGNADVSGLRGQAQLARNQGRGGLGRSLDFRASAMELDVNFRAQIRELEELRYTGALTAEEFSRLREAAESANQVSMQNLIEETNRAEREARLAVQQRLSSTEAGLMRSRASLAGIRGDSYGSQKLNLEAQVIETRASLDQQMEDLRKFRSEVGLTNDEFKTMADQIKTANSLELTGLQEQIDQLGQGVQYSLDTMRQMASFGRKLSNETPAFGTKTEYSTSDLLRAALSPSARGPGGLFSYVASGKFGEQGMLAAKLADLVQANPFNAISAQMQANKIAEGVDAGTLQVTPELISKIDELIQATKSSAGRPSLTINSVENIGLAGQIYNDLSRDSFRSSGF